MQAKSPVSHTPSVVAAARSAKTVTLRRQLLGFLALAAVLAGGVWVARWARASSVNFWVIQQGREIIQADAPLEEQSASVERWVEQTRSSWPRDLDSLIEALYNAGPAESPQVRVMIERLARVNYAGRGSDWQRWYESRGGMFGEGAAVPAKERVALKQRWQAPVGLTGWFSTVLALDGRIYVPSLGRALNDPTDLDDGVVIVDGATGSGHLVPAPATPGSRDVLGLSAGNDRIFAVQLNGYVYALNGDGDPLWSTEAKFPATGAPMSCDIAGDGTIDVVVPLKSGRVAAFHGASGKQIWRSESTGGGEDIGAVLSVGREGNLWLTTTDGHVAGLNPRNGVVEFRGRAAPGTLSGVLSDGGQARDMRWLADREGRLWSIPQHGRNKFSLVPSGPPAGENLTLVAGVRTLRQGANDAPLLLLCPTAEYLEGRASAWALSFSGTYWRIPVPGAVWATPLVANLNQTPESEIVLATIIPGEQDATRGALRVISPRGHALASVPLAAAVEATPLLTDVDGDQKLELLVIEQSGTMTCFSTRSAGPVEWGSLGGDPHNTRDNQNAFSFGQRPFGMQWLWKPEGVIKG